MKLPDAKSLLILAVLAISFSSPSLLAGNLMDGNGSPDNTYQFIENKGQIIDQEKRPNPEVLFLLNTPGMNVQLKSEGFSYDFYHISETGHRITNAPFFPEAEQSDQTDFHQQCTDIRFHRIDFQFLTTNPHCRITPTMPSQGYLNFYTTGTPQEGVTHVRHYRQVVYREFYPGIDLEFLATDSASLKYNFILHPGARIGDIRFRVEGTTNIREKDGGLFMVTTFGKILESIPASFAVTDGVIKEVNAGFVHLADGIFGIRLKEKIPPKSTVIIDPIPERLWGTYYGGLAPDDLRSSSAAPDGNIYAAGIAVSTMNIATSGSHQAVIGGSKDAFLAKFSTTGIRLWATYYGGSGTEEGYGCSVDISGNVYLCGNTQSTTNISTPGAHQEIFAGSLDAFLAKFNADGIRQWGTYYGGNDNDSGLGCITDSLENVFLCGSSRSSFNISTPGSHQPGLSGQNDGFLVKFDAGGIRQWATYYGGTGADGIEKCASDRNRNIIITGWTSSTTNIATPGAHQVSLAGGVYDGFIAQFSETGTCIWGTYYGGTGNDQSLSCAVDMDNGILVAGLTSSNSGISTAGAHQVNPGSTNDGFLSKFSESGIQRWGSYYGGSNLDRTTDICTDPDGNVLIAGESRSLDNIATPGSYQPDNAGSYDAFLALFNPEGERQWGTYYGGLEDELYSRCTVDANGNLFLSGSTSSLENISSPGAHQVVFGGMIDGYLAKFNACPVPGAADPVTGPAAVCMLSSGYIYSIPEITNATTYHWSVPPGAVITAGAGTQTIVLQFTGGASSGSVSVYGVNSCGTGDSAWMAVTVNLTPYVDFILCDTLTSRDAQPFLLRGGLITGGNYSGPGVNAGYFIPSLLPPGEDTAIVTYTYTSADNCSDSASQIITVLPSQPFTCGNSFTDIRDGTSYPTVLIGTQCWFSKNLNLGDPLSALANEVPADNCTPEKYCLNDNPVSCISEGGLYTWDEAMQYLTQEGLQGVCPPGWHIPSESEWNVLFAFLNGNADAGDALKTGGPSGFNGLLSGARFNYQIWHFFNVSGFFWSSSDHGPSKAWAHGINLHNHSVSTYPSHRSGAFSVRCLRD